MTEFGPNHPVSLTKPLPAAAAPPQSALAPYAGPPTGPIAPTSPGAPARYGYAPVPTPLPYPASTTSVVVQQSNAEIVIAWIFTGLTLLYMLPWAIAATRRSTNSILIAVATFFLAWTIVGWLVLLVLSFLGPTVHTVRATATYAPVPPPPQAGTWAYCAGDPPHVRRWWDGRAWTAHTTVV